MLEEIAVLQLLIAKQETYPVPGHLESFRDEFLEIVDANVRFHSEVEVAPCGGAHMDRYLRMWATPLRNGVSGRMRTVFH
jgi:hypothetical protein